MFRPYRFLLKLRLGGSGRGRAASTLTAGHGACARTEPCANLRIRAGFGIRETSMRSMLLATGFVTLGLTACSQGAAGPFVGFGPKPDLPTPTKSALPTVNVAKFVGWPKGAAPTAPPGFVVTRFADGL